MYSLYLRPWVLDDACATEEVPHIRSLDLLPDSKRLRTKVTKDSYFRSYASTWSWYVRGNVVTEHARQIIVQFMAACIGSSGKHEERPEECVEEENSSSLPAVDLALMKVHEILDRMSEDKKADQPAEKGQGASDEEVDDKALEQSSQIHDAMKLTAKLWSRSAQVWGEGEIDVRNSTVPDLLQSLATASARRKSTKKQNRLHPKVRQSLASRERK